MRIKNVDALRGVAILLVLGEHKHVSDLWTRIGWTGVDLFFVLSGFLISGLLFAETKKYGSITLSRFFIRRGLKIYPGYYLLVFYLLFRDLIQGRELTEQVALKFVFLQNYGPGPVDHTWSLAVEEHFYLLLPALLTGLLSLRRRKLERGGESAAGLPPSSGVAFSSLPRILLATGVVLLLLRVLTYLWLPYDNITHHFPTHLRIDSLLFGVVIGYYYHFHQEAFFKHSRLWRHHILAGSCVLLLSAVLLERTTFWMSTFGLAALYIGFGGLLVLVLPNPGARQIRAISPVATFQRIWDVLKGVLAFVGYYSYAIYLWHPPVGSGGMRVLRRVLNTGISPLVEFGLYLVGSILLGIVMTKVVENPTLRLRDRIWPSRGAAL